MDEVDRFAGRLRELREAQGLSRQELADKAGMKVGGIRDLEQGRRKPTWETVIAIAKALDVDCTAFLEEPILDPPSGPGRPKNQTRETPPTKLSRRVPQEREAKGKADSKEKD